MIPRFIHCAGDVVEQGARARVLPLGQARSRAEDWRIAAAAHLALDRPRLSALYARAALELASAVRAADRWRDAAAIDR